MYDVLVAGGWGGLGCWTANDSTCGDGGEEEFLDSGTVKVSVADVREVRIDIKESRSRDPSRSWSRRVCSFAAGVVTNEEASVDVPR